VQKFRQITRDYGFLHAMAPSSAPLFLKPKKERDPEFDGIDCIRSIIQLITLQKEIESLRSLSLVPLVLPHEQLQILVEFLGRI
jgi:hypothetical protein